MQTRYLVDWCPVSTVPIRNAVLKSFGCTRSHRNDLNPEWKTLFDQYSQLLSCEYCVRLDGIFVIRVNHADNLQSERWLELVSEISDLVKRSCHHIHDFHRYASSISSKSADGWFAQIRNGLRRGMRGALDILGLSEEKFSIDLDLVLHVPPVETEDPAAAPPHSAANRQFQRLEHFLQPSGQDAYVAQLRARFERPADMDRLYDQRALLRLRALYAQKKDRCFLAFDRRLRRGYSFALLPILFFLGAYAISYYTLRFGFHIGPITSITFAFVPALGAFIISDLGRHSAKLELLQRTIGFYSYATIYSRILQAIYSKMQAAHEFCCDTGNFSDVTKALEARHSIEKERIERRKFFLGLMFTLFTVSVTLSKLAVEWEQSSSIARATKASSIKASGNGRLERKSVPPSLTPLSRRN